MEELDVEASLRMRKWSNENISIGDILGLDELGTAEHDNDETRSIDDSISRRTLEYLQADESDIAQAEDSTSDTETFTQRERYSTPTGSNDPHDLSDDETSTAESDTFSPTRSLAREMPSDTSNEFTSRAGTGTHSELSSDAESLLDSLEPNENLGPTKDDSLAVLVQKLANIAKFIQEQGSVAVYSQFIYCRNGIFNEEQTAEEKMSMQEAYMFDKWKKGELSLPEIYWERESLPSTAARSIRRFELRAKVLNQIFANDSNDPRASSAITPEHAVWFSKTCTSMLPLVTALERVERVKVNQRNGSNNLSKHEFAELQTVKAIQSIAASKINGQSKAQPVLVLKAQTHLAALALRRNMLKRKFLAGQLDHEDKILFNKKPVYTNAQPRHFLKQLQLRGPIESSRGSQSSSTDGSDISLYG